MDALALALLLTAAPAAEPPPPLVVQGSLVRLRQEPSEQAPVVARLHLGTPLTLLEERAEWVRVSVAEHPGLDGWVSGRLLGGVAPTEALRKRALLAEGTPRFAEAAERLVASEGTRVQDLQLLERAYAQAGRAADAAQVRARLDGRESFLLAECRQGRALLAARVTADGVDALADADKGALPLLQRALREVDALPWFEATRAGAVRVPGSPFARPRLAPVWNEGSDALQGEMGPDGSEAKLVLGPCTRDGALLATTPLALLEAGGVSASAAESAMRQAGRALPATPWNASGAVQVGVEVLRPFPDAEFVVAMARWEATWPGHHDDFQGRAWVWGLLDGEGTVLSVGPQGSLRRFQVGGDRWLRRALAPGSPLRLGVVAVEAWDEGSPSGLQVILATPRGPRATVLCAFDRAGC